MIRAQPDDPARVCEVELQCSVTIVRVCVVELSTIHLICFSFDVVDDHLVPRVLVAKEIGLLFHFILFDGNATYTINDDRRQRPLHNMEGACQNSTIPGV